MNQRDKNYGAALPNQMKDGATVRIAQNLVQRRRKFADEIPGGVGDNANPTDFDPAELEAGIQEELEHTNDLNIAREIAMDHLTENPNYYSKMAVRIASVNEVPESFTSVGGGVYKQGHQLWDLQKVQDPNQPFRLVRKHDERFSDMMDRDLDALSFGASKTASVESSHDIRVGEKVETIRDGRIAQGIVLVIEEADDTADIEYEDGMVEEGCPLEMLTSLGLPGMPMLELVEMSEGETSENEEIDDDDDDDNDDNDDKEDSKGFEPVVKDATFWLRVAQAEEDLDQQEEDDELVVHIEDDRPPTVEELMSNKPTSQQKELIESFMQFVGTLQNRWSYIYNELQESTGTAAKKALKRDLYQLQIKISKAANVYNKMVRQLGASMPTNELTKWLEEMSTKKFGHLFDPFEIDAETEEANTWADNLIISARTAQQNMHDLAIKCEQIIESAKQDLGSDLGGYSALDLCADNLPGIPLDALRDTLAAIGY